VTIRSEVRDDAGALVLDLASTCTLRRDGTIVVHIPAVATADRVGRFAWDLFVDTPGPTSTCLAEGHLTVHGRTTVGADQPSIGVDAEAAHDHHHTRVGLDRDIDVFDVVTVGIPGPPGKDGKAGAVVATVVGGVTSVNGRDPDQAGDVGGFVESADGQNLTVVRIPEDVMDAIPRPLPDNVIYITR